MPNEPTWLTLEAAITANQRAVADTGEPFFIRDQGLLESALAKPQNHWAYGETDLAFLAVALLFGIARNHPFGQGNKRTAFAAARYFLWLNGYELTAPDADELADRVVDLITGAMTETEFIDLVREHAQPV
ncbi:MAG TPA: type II toxin-antitoxin system death-on-curing family toxin [Allosphingosinicella sp.]